MPSRSTNNFVRPPVVLLAVAELSVFFAAVHLGLLAIGELYDSNGVYSPTAVWPKALIVSAMMFLSFLSMGLYNFHQRIEYLDVVARIFVGLFIGSVGLSVVYYLVPICRVSLAGWAISMAAALVAVLPMRHYFIRNVDENVFRRNILILGAGERAAGIASLRRRADRRGFKIVGIVPMPGDVVDARMQSLITNGGDILKVARSLGADDVVIALDDRRGMLPIRDLLNCKLHGIDVLDLLEFLERESGKIRADLVNPGWLIFSSGFRVNRVRRSIKRFVDIVVSAAAILLLWPIFLLVAIMIKLEDGIRSQVFYRQQRVGLRGEEFRLLKFRSMRSDAEADGTAVWAQKNDDRVTWVGRYIRKFRIDEFPQLLNVLLGQMSIVGPRPERPAFVNELSKTIPYYDERHTVKPGVTGWAQLRYSYGSSTEDSLEKLHYDLYYVKNHNLVLDIAIMIQTVEIMLWGKGAR